MKILSNKEYKKLKDAEFDSTMYYNECETLKNRKNKLLQEIVELETERDMYKSDFIKAVGKCKCYKKQVEELTADSIVKDERITELEKEIENLKSKNKLPKEQSTKKKATKKVAKKEK